MGLTSAINDLRLRRVGGFLLSEEVGQVDEAELAQLSRPPAERWRVVKRNPSRTVYFGQLAGRDVYLKHFHIRSLARRLFRRLRRSDLWCEVNYAAYLGARGVATAEVLAAGQANGAAWLATQAVAPATQADKWHERQLALGRAGRRAIRQATVALAEMIARLHACGVIHSDLHCGNIMIRTDTPSPQPVLMDLHRARRHRRLSRRTRAANLAHLFHDRQCLTSRSDRLRFLKHYLAAGNAGGTLRGWQVMIEDLARRHARRQYANRDKRVLRKDKYFCPVKLPGGWRGHVVLATKHAMGGSRASGMEFAPADWQEALADPEALFSGEGAETIKDSRSSQIVRREIKVGARGVRVYVKRARRKQPWKALIDCFRASRSIRAFRLGHALRNRWIPTALPLAALERRVGPLLLDSILIVEAVDAPRLNRFLDTWLARQPAADARLTAAQQHGLGQEVLWQLGRLVQRLHDHNFAHRDLKASNLLVRWSPGGSPEVVLVDMDGLSRRRRLTTRRRFQGLMRLNVSLLECPAVNHAGRLRMLLGYLRRPGCGRVDYKPYWRVLEDWSASKLRRQIRSRRRRQKAVRRPAS